MIAEVKFYFRIANILLGGLRVACLFCLTKVKNTSNYDTELSLTGERGITKPSTKNPHFCGSGFAPFQVARDGED
jgi:hypothetical protein